MKKITPILILFLCFYNLHLQAQYDINFSKNATIHDGKVINKDEGINYSEPVNFVKTGFCFLFKDRSVSNLWISNKGWFSFYFEVNNKTENPDLNYAAFPWSDDETYEIRVSEINTIDEKSFTIQWSNENRTFQAKLYNGTNEIEFLYLDGDFSEFNDAIIGASYLETFYGILPEENTFFMKHVDLSDDFKISKKSNLIIKTN